MLDRECRRCWTKSKAMVEMSWKKRIRGLPVYNTRERINAKASQLKLHRLHDRYKYTAIAMGYPAISNINLCILKMERSTNERYNAIWYTTFRKKAMSKSTTAEKYRNSPTGFFNTLRNTGPESPLRSPFRRPIDVDIFTSSIAFLAKDDSHGTTEPTRVNVC